MLHVFFKILFTPFFWLFYWPKVEGLRHLFIKGSAIIISNHFSLTDPIRIAFVAPRAIHFMAKQELFTTPIKRWFLNSLLAFPVYRRHADMTSLKQAMTVLEKGRVFGIFPEGRRSLTNELDIFEKGAAFLALRCNAPIIPLYADPEWKKHGRIRMIVGEPMNPKVIADATAGRSVDAVTDAIFDRMQELKNQMERSIP